MSTPDNRYAAPTVTDLIRPVDVEQADAERIKVLLGIVLALVGIAIVSALLSRGR